MTFLCRIDKFLQKVDRSVRCITFAPYVFQLIEEFPWTSVEARPWAWL